MMKKTTHRKNSSAALTDNKNNCPQNEKSENGSCIDYWFLNELNTINTTLGWVFVKGLLGDEHRLVELDGKELGGALEAHGDSVEDLRAGHGLAVMGDDDEL